MRDGTLNDSFESFLSRVEGDAMPILKGLQDRDITIAGIDREKLAVFLSLMLYRVPVARDWIDGQISDLGHFSARCTARQPGLLEAQIEQYERETGKKIATSAEKMREFLLSNRYSVKASSAMSLKAVADFSLRLSMALMGMEWTVLKTDGDEVFTTSDNPVVYSDTKGKSAIWGCPILNQNVEIIFPMSPKRCALLTHDRPLWQRLDLVRGGDDLRKLFSSHTPKTTYRLAPSRAVTECNRRIALGAKRYAFSSINTATLQSVIGENLNSESANAACR
jgi:hypothetical protein